MRKKPGSNGRAAAKSLELGVDDLAEVVNLNHQLHHVTTSGRADHAGADIDLLGVELANVARVVEVVVDGLAIGAACNSGKCHYLEKIELANKNSREILPLEF